MERIQINLFDLRWSVKVLNIVILLLHTSSLCFSRMIKCQPQEYSFIPKTWIFPAEYTQFQNYVKELRRKRKQKTFIVKPANGAMGHG